MLSANTIKRSLTQIGSGRKVNIGVNVAFRRLALSFGAVECATTHKVHWADSVRFE